MNKNLIRDISVTLNVIAIMVITLMVFTFKSEINTLESEIKCLEDATNMLQVELLDAQGKVEE